MELIMEVETTNIPRYVELKDQAKEIVSNSFRRDFTNYNQDKVNELINMMTEKITSLENRPKSSTAKITREKKLEGLKSYKENLEISIRIFNEFKRNYEENAPINNTMEKDYCLLKNLQVIDCVSNIHFQIDLKEDDKISTIKCKLIQELNKRDWGSYSRIAETYERISLRLKGALLKDDNKTLYECGYTEEGRIYFRYSPSSI
jgi:hypothetical protein